MPATRKQVRDLFADAIEQSKAGWHVFSGKHITDLENAIPCASIYIDGATISADLVTNGIATAQVSIHFVTCGDDDETDEIVDKALVAIRENKPLKAAVMSHRLVSFSYERDAYDPYLCFVAEFDVMYVVP